MMANILIIDDDYYLRFIMRIILEGAGHKVFETSNGLDGERAFFSNEIDIVFTDIFMPEQDGLQTIINIRKSNHTVQIVTMSSGGHSRELDYLMYSEIIGATYSLIKPISLVDILSIASKASLCLRSSHHNRCNIVNSFQNRNRSLARGKNTGQGQ